ncbi:MAG: DUF973 family protein [Thermoplasmata archaeon]
MASSVCLKCGRANPPEARYCLACGAPLGTLSAVPAPMAAPLPTAYPMPPSPPGSWNAGTGFPGPMPVAVPDHIRQIDLRAIEQARTSALIAIVGLLVSAVFLFFDFLGYGTLGTANVTNFSLDTTLTSAALGGVLTILSMIFGRRCFVLLRPIDSRFSTPASLSLVALVGLAIALIGEIVLLALFIQSSGCASELAAPANCGVQGFTTDTLIALGFAGLGGLLLLIGGIGMLIGIYRLGTRFDVGLFKVGAILLIFPILSLIGVILIYVATSNARTKVESVPRAPTLFPPVGAPVYPPPPR